MKGSRVDDEFEAKLGKDVFRSFRLCDIEIRIKERKNIVSLKDFDQIRPELPVSSDDRNFHFYTMASIIQAGIPEPRKPLTICRMRPESIGVDLRAYS